MIRTNILSPRITILIRLFSIHEGDELEIGVENDAIVIRKLEASCVFCGSIEAISAFKGRGVCAECRRSLTAG